MKTIEISDEQYNFFCELRDNLKNQDNRSTCLPIMYQIRYKEKVPTDTDYEDGWEWIDMRGHSDFTRYDSDNELYEMLIEEEWDELNEVIVKESINDNSSLSHSCFRELGSYFDFIVETMGFEKVSYKLVEQVQQSFLTRAALDEHVRQNGHNLPEGWYTFVVHCYRDPEMKQLIDFILGVK